MATGEFTTHAGKYPTNLVLLGIHIKRALPWSVVHKGTLRPNADQGRNIAIATIRLKGATLSEGSEGSASRYFKHFD